MNKSKWVGEMAENKMRRQAKGVKRRGHLAAHEGGLVIPGVIVGEGLLARIRRVFRRKTKTAQPLRVVE